MSILIPSRTVLVPSRSLSLPALEPYSVRKERQGVLYEVGVSNLHWFSDVLLMGNYGIFGDLYLDIIKEEEEKHKSLLGSLKSRIFGDKEREFFLVNQHLDTWDFGRFFGQLNLWLNRDYKKQILHEDADFFFLDIYEHFKAISDKVNRKPRT